MKRFLVFILVGFGLTSHPILYGQSGDTPTRLFRIYEDNDFLNIRGNGTDNSYTNGLRFDYFYTKKKASKFFIDRLLPKAGGGSDNVFGWSLTQLMVTPNDITSKEYQLDDYPYAGALFTTHSLYSLNSIKKFSFQTELVAGIRGPASFAREAQTFVHSVINYDKPMGWDNQLETYPLLNVNFAVEKQLFSFGSFVEVIGGAQIAAGSFLDAFSIYPLIRIGKMSPYFDSYFNRFGSYYRNGKKVKTQYYLVIKPENSLVAHNALLHGKRLNTEPGTSEEDATTRTIRHRISSIQFGAVVAHGNFGLSYLQTHSTEFNQGLYRHNWGNLSFHFRW